MTERAAVHRDRTRPVRREDPRQRLANALQRHAVCHRLESPVRAAPQRMQHAGRVVVELVEVASLDAAVAVIDGVVDVADQAGDAPCSIVTFRPQVAWQKRQMPVVSTWRDPLRGKRAVRSRAPPRDRQNL